MTDVLHNKKTAICFNVQRTSLPIYPYGPNA